jgi:hypothetical protein
MTILTGNNKALNAAIGIGSALYMLSIPKDIAALTDEQRSATLDQAADEFVQTLRVLGFEVVAVAKGEAN